MVPQPLARFLERTAPRRFPDPRTLIDADGRRTIEEAIGRVEEQTSGEVRVVVIGPCRGDLLRRARREFARLRMAETRERTGVLILISTWRRRFAIWADEGIHAKVPAETWMRLARTMGSAFQEGHFARGVLAVTSEVGGLLAAHFPRRPDDTNELANTVVIR